MYNKKMSTENRCNEIIGSLKIKKIERRRNAVLTKTVVFMILNLVYVIIRK